MMMMKKKEIKQQPQSCEIAHRIQIGLERAQTIHYVCIRMVPLNVNNRNNKRWTSKLKRQQRRRNITNDHDDDAMMVLKKKMQNTSESRNRKKNWRISRTREKWNWIFSHIHMILFFFLAWLGLWECLLFFFWSMKWQRRRLTHNEEQLVRLSAFVGYN